MGISELPSLNVSSRRSQAYRLLRRSIVSGKIPAGTRLVASQLAEQLGISRTPLREALQLLEKEGFVRRLPTGIVEVVALSREEVEEVFAIRAVLEGLVARYAALRATREEIATVESLLNEISKAVQKSDYEAVDIKGAEFHALIQQAARLPLAGKQLENMRDHINRYRAQSIPRRGRGRSAVEEHAEIVKYIKARNGEAAEEAMKRHIRNAWQTIKESMSK